MRQDEKATSSRGRVRNAVAHDPSVSTDEHHNESSRIYSADFKQYHYKCCPYVYDTIDERRHVNHRTIDFDDRPFYSDNGAGESNNDGCLAYDDDEYPHF